MSNRKIKKFRAGKGIKKVTKLPNFVLRIKGRLDSKKGDTVASAYIDKLKNRCAAIENGEALKAENFLLIARTEGARALSTIKKYKDILTEIPDSVKENSPYDIRANRRNLNQKKIINADIKSVHAKLTEVKEKIIDLDTVLDERVSETRKRASEKIDVYVYGLRAGKLSIYNPELSFSDDARIIYNQRHSSGDKRIFDAAL